MADNRYRIGDVKRLVDQQPSAELFWEVYRHITTALQRTSREAVGTRNIPDFGFGLTRDAKTTDGHIRKRWHFTIRACEGYEGIRISCFPAATRHCPEKFDHLATLFPSDNFPGPFDKTWDTEEIGLTIASMSRWREHSAYFLDTLEVVGSGVRAEINDALADTGAKQTT